MSDMMMEVDDALRAQQLKALWDRFGQWLIGLALVVVIATAVGVTWHNHQTKILSEQSSTLLSILQNEAENAKTPQELTALSKKANLPLKAVVELYRAQKFEQAKDLSAAQKLYGQLARQAKTPQILQDVARLHFVRLGLVQYDKPEKLLAMINPLTKENSNFRASALDMKATILVLQNKSGEANKIYAQLASDETAPTSLRNRAKAMMQDEGK